MKDNKNLFLVIGLVALLVVVAIINYSLSKNTDQAVDADTYEYEENLDDGIKSTDLQVPVISSGDTILEYKVQRQDVRQKEIEHLDSIIENEKTEQEVLSEAQMQKIEITKNMEIELTLEGLIKAKGYEDAIVTVKANSVNIVVKTKSLTEKQAAEILDIAKTETDQPARNIKIMPQE